MAAIDFRPVTDDSIPPPDTPPVTAPVSITEPPADTTSQISLAPAGPAPVQPPPQPIAKAKADKFNYTFGDSGVMDAAQVYMRISKGDEPGVREQYAAYLDQQKAKQKQQMLLDAANQKGSPLDFADVRTILDPFNPS